MAAGSVMAADPATIDWTKVPVSKLTLFYPGQSSYEWVRNDHKGGKGAKSDLPTPREIRQILDQYVIGQDRAKRSLAVAVRLIRLGPLIFSRVASVSHSPKPPRVGRPYSSSTRRLA